MIRASGWGVTSGTWFIAVFAIGACAAQSSAATKYVDASRPDDSGDGLSWASAKKTLQAALYNAVSGDEIWVAAGTYRPDQGVGQIPGDRLATFQLINGVALYGGFPLGGGDGTFGARDISANETVLSGDLAGDDIPLACVFDSPDCSSNGRLCVEGSCIIAQNNADNSYHVVTGNGAGVSGVVDGFTITGGNANGSEPNDRGGGMLSSGGSPTVINCTFTGNAAGNGGGGMCNQSYSSPTVTNCTFRRNWGVSQGGGMFNNNGSSPTVTTCGFSENYGGGMANGLDSSPSVSDCVFSGNIASSGGGIENGLNSIPTVSYCVFNGNRAGVHGGGMYNNDSSPTLIGCMFNENRAQHYGGGMYSESSVLTVSNCGFIGNRADARGGGMANVSTVEWVTDCTFDSNTAGQQGGGMYNESSSPVVTGCTFSGNSVNSAGGGMSNEASSSPRLLSCMFLGNSAGAFGGGMHNEISHPAVANCTFSGNAAGNSGGGMYNAAGSPTVTSSSFSRNSASVDGGGIKNRELIAGTSNPTLANCILWSNSDAGGMDGSAQMHTDFGTPTVNYSIVQGGWTGAGGVGNSTSDPLFIDADGDDDLVGTEDDNLRLMSGSPAIDAGDNDALPADVADFDGDLDTTEALPVDLDGVDRRVDDPLANPDSGNPGALGIPVVDMGAYEFPYGDCNRNGIRDVDDIANTTSPDCDGNTVPDECDIANCSPGDATCDDCNLNQIPDICEGGPFAPCPGGCPTHSVCDCGTCLCDAGWTGSDCDSAVCGDGFVREAEECDDGDFEDGDGCSSTCEAESGYICDGSEPSICTDEDECALGTDNCDVNAACTNTPGSFTCTCNAGYSGDGVTCTDDDECTVGTDNCVVAWGANDYGQTNVPAPNSGFMAVAGGYEHSLGLKADGSIAAWGDNDYGQSNVPAPNTGFIAVAAALGHSLGLKADGSIVAWGGRGFGETDVPAPNSEFIAVAAGLVSYSLGLTADGSIVAWGDNQLGQTDVPAPNADFIGIAAGGAHGMGLKIDGSIVAWGFNSFGQTNVPAPNTDFVAIAAGREYSLGLKADGSIVAWGDNRIGQTNVPTPNGDFIAVAAGWDHGLGLKADGSIIAWGRNDYGQTNVPVPAPNMRFVAMAAGELHSLAVQAIADCDNNGIDDSVDIADCAGDPACGDCDGNGIPDGCDIESCSPGDTTCEDCDLNEVPDSCEGGPFVPCSGNCSSNGVCDCGTCLCGVGWTGPDCGVSICGDGFVRGAEECDDGDLDDGDGCSSACAVEGGYTCDAGEPSVCIDIDECAIGTDNCHVNALCTNTPNGFTCTCNAGYSGDGITCTDDDECALGTDDCDANAVCTNTPGGFTCWCKQGYCGDGGGCDVCEAIYVDASATGAGAGTSWADALTSLQDGLSAAASSGPIEVWVAAGTYRADQGVGQTLGDRAATFQLVNGVAIYGGFPPGGGDGTFGARDIAANETVLSGDLAGDDAPLACVEDSPDCDFNGGLCVGGFCIIAQNNTENSFHVVTGSGTDATARLDGFTITAGNADGSEGSFPGGGGMYNGGGSPTMANCTLAGNTAAFAGGGMRNQSSSNPMVTNCTFNCNFAEFQGGGMYNSSSSPTVTGCTFVFNTADHGSAIYNGPLNTSPTITNCIFWANPRVQIETADSNLGTPVVNYSIVQGGWIGAGGTGILDIDPLFVDAAGGNLRLQYGSPAIDAGANNAVPAGVFTDRDGKPRVVDDPHTTDTGDPGAAGPAIADMGAYEFQPVPCDNPADCDDGLFCNGAEECDIGIGFCEPRTGACPEQLCIEEIDSCEDFVTLFVDADATGANNGTSWEDAFSHLQDALAAAQASAGLVNQIWVAAASYMPDGGYIPSGGSHVTGSGDRSSTFQLLNGVTLYGGFPPGGGDGTFAARDIAANETVLNGDLGGNDSLLACAGDDSECNSNGRRCVDGFCIIAANNAENSYHVVSGSGRDATAALDGFTITAGNADGADDSGGGMRNVLGSPSVSNCAFKGSFANDGGAVFNDGSSPAVTNCTFAENAATVGGGGMANFFNSNPIVRNCEFRDNTAIDGGGMVNSNQSHPMITDCAFIGNSKVLSGGGVTNNFDSSPTVTNCLFAENSAEYVGGGMDNYEGSSPIVTNCVFTGNTAESAGGMDNTSNCSPKLTNCTFFANVATSSGGGLFGDSGAPLISNCIFSGNSDAGGMDESAQIHFTSGTPIVNYSIVQGGWSGAGGMGNSAEDPLFVDPFGPDATPGTADDELSLGVGSPGIDAGDNSDVSAVIDIRGNGRVLDGNGDDIAVVDVGAYEAAVVSAVSAGETVEISPSTAPGDLMQDAAISLTNESGDVATVSVAQTTVPPNANTAGFELFGTFVTVDASLGDGSFLLTVTAPFSIADVSTGVDPVLDIDLGYYRPLQAAWVNATCDNVQAGTGCDQFGVPLGTRHAETGSQAPTLANLHDRMLGDYGVYWDGAAGFVWANVDHASIFAPASARGPGGLAADSSGIARSRFVSFVVPPASAGADSALRVQLSSLHHPTDPPAGTPSFASFEGQYRYVNTFDGTFTCPDSANQATSYFCAQLGCQPEYRDWGAEVGGQVLHVTGNAVVSSSVYEVSHIAETCGAAPAADTCMAASAGLDVATGRWGDVVGPGNGPPDNINNVLDISATVDKVKDLPQAFDEARIWHKQRNPNPVGESINVIDIASVVDAVKNLPYPASFTIDACP